MVPPSIYLPPHRWAIEEHEDYEGILWSSDGRGKSRSNCLVPIKRPLVSLGATADKQFLIYYSAS